MFSSSADARSESFAAFFSAFLRRILASGPIC